MKRLIILVSGLVLVAAAAAHGGPYEYTYYPPESPYLQGREVPGAFPWEQGWVVYSHGQVDASIDWGVYALRLEATYMNTWETYSSEDMGPVNPEPGEYLYVEWRMMVVTDRFSGDTLVTVALDDFGGDMTVHISRDGIHDYEGFKGYDFTPGEFHTFVIRSVNLLDYDLFVDGEYAFSDVFKTPTSLSSFVDWGDGSSSYSTSLWQYFRCGGAPLGDIDIDGSVDLVDFATFAMCFTNGGTYAPPGCSDQEFALSDLDNDGDTDLVDFATFAVNYTN